MFLPLIKIIALCSYVGYISTYRMAKINTTHENTTVQHFFSEKLITIFAKII